MNNTKVAKKPTNSSNDQEHPISFRETDNELAEFSKKASLKGFKFIWAFFPQEHLTFSQH